MSKEIKRLVTISIISTIIACQQAWPGKNEGQKVFDDMVALLDSAEYIRFDFTRIVSSPFTGASDTSKGTAFIKGDEFSKIVIDGRTVIARHDTIYDYSASFNQLTISPAGNNFSMKELIISDYFENYRLSDFSKPNRGTYLFDLIENDSSYQYTDVRLITRRVDNPSGSGSLVIPFVITYTDEMRRHIIWNFDTDMSDKNDFWFKAFPDSVFDFEVPEGCRVVSMFE